MEFGFFPRSFGVQRDTVQTPQGEQQVMRIQIQDVSGAVAIVTFGLQDWDMFVKACTDPEAAAARSRITVPRLASSLGERKH